MDTHLPGIDFCHKIRAKTPDQAQFPSRAQARKGLL
jgi:hypothetical protein